MTGERQIVYRAIRHSMLAENCAFHDIKNKLAYLIDARKPSSFLTRKIIPHGLHVQAQWIYMQIATRKMNMLRFKGFHFEHLRASNTPKRP